MLIFVLKCIFWISVFLFVYSYTIYPLLLAIFAKFFGKSVKRKYDIEFPFVAFIVPVYNEEKIIKQKIENILSLDYPNDRLTIWIGSDCSTDKTHEIVNTFKDSRIKLWIAEKRGGKTEVINKLTPSLNADILVFTDANTMHKKDSLKKMIGWFADSKVGGVAGHIEHVFNRNNIEEKIYRNFESLQKSLESKLHSTISAFGGFYSIRKEVFSSIKYNAYSNDDVLIPMNVIRKGFRMIFDKEAVSYEDSTDNIKNEFSRRVRIGAGNFQAFSWLLDFLNPLKGWPWFCYVSHKVTRWFSPFFLILAFLSCFLLVVLNGPILYHVIFYLACLILILSLLYLVLPLFFIRPFFYFLSMHLALFLGFFRFLGGIKSAAWMRTERNV
jgi:cellulose synthase/poly-beta-1,6-N-acetylglucosamine synthase-like glycosyltransferase